MEMRQVESSQIESVGYDEATKRLRVKFHSSPTPYEYIGVPAEKHQELLEAESPGLFLAAEIKGVFDYERVEEDDEAEDGLG